MTIRTELELEHESYKTAVIEHSKNLIEEFKSAGEAQTYLYNIDDNSMPKNATVWNIIHQLECHLLLQNFKEIVNREDRSYRKGDLWILGGALEIREKVIEDLYNELERQNTE